MENRITSEGCIMEVNLTEIKGYCDKIKTDVNDIKVRHQRYLATKPHHNVISAMLLLLKH